MGAKTSKQEYNHSPLQNTKSYKNVFRAYAKWEHHSGLVSDDILRFTSHENRNLKRHNQFCQNNSNQQQIIQPYNTKQSSSNQQIQSHFLPRKKPRYDENIHGKRLTIRKSQSMEHLSNSKNLITAEQLIKNQFERQQRYRSSFSQKSNQIFQNETIQKSPLITNTNQFISSKDKIKQIPPDLQLVLINQHDLQVNFIHFIIYYLKATLPKLNFYI